MRIEKIETGVEFKINNRTVSKDYPCWIITDGNARQTAKGHAGAYKNKLRAITTLLRKLDLHVSLWENNRRSRAYWAPAKILHGTPFGYGVNFYKGCGYYSKELMSDNDSILYLLASTNAKGKEKLDNFNLSDYI